MSLINKMLVCVIVIVVADAAVCHSDCHHMVTMSLLSQSCGQQPLSSLSWLSDWGLAAVFTGRPW